MTKEDLMQYGFDRALTYDDLVISHKNLIQSQEILPTWLEYTDYYTYELDKLEDKFND